MLQKGHTQCFQIYNIGLNCNLATIKTSYIDFLENAETYQLFFLSSKEPVGRICPITQTLDMPAIDYVLVESILIKLIQTTLEHFTLLYVKII